MASSTTLLPSSLSSRVLTPLPHPCLLSPSPQSSLRPISASSSVTPSSPSTSRRSLIVSLPAFATFLSLPAMADIEDDYKSDTQQVIVQVRSTLGLDKSDPSRGDAVKALRQASNDWVAKYRREKRFAGKPSFSNMYSVLNAVSGHFISYGDGSPLPAKRKTQILEEVEQAERALGRGR